jgi:hypothetical protein
MIARFFTYLGLKWCRALHRKSEMWPIHGKYTCSHCLREHVVRWERHGAQLGRFHT